MMENKVNMLFHGSNMVVSAPKILTNGHYKDFGYGFYCTKIEKQARRWAITRSNKHIVNAYSYVPEQSLRVLSFASMTEDWLSFVVACRSGIEHTYDIVEGPMADDTIWNYIEDYVNGAISKSAFWELVKFKFPTHQIVFCTEKALRTLKFERSYFL